MSRPLAVVIGAGPGLGLALVRRFAHQGMRVAFAARRPAAVAEFQRLLDTEGLDTCGFVADAARPDQITRMLADLRSRHDTPQVLIYNAAVIEPSRFVTPSAIEMAAYAGTPGWTARGEPIDFEGLIDGFKANVAGALHAVQQVAPGMIARGSGSILVSGGVLAFGPWIEWGAVSLGKAALRSLCHSLFLELRPHGVQVCVVAIHGTMKQGSPYDHDRVADAYWRLHVRPPAEWQPDHHFKAAVTDGKDPDA